MGKQIDTIKRSSTITAIIRPKSWRRLAAARQIWKGRIVTVFQPHRYSRTLHCREDFAKAFSDSDVVLITDIYARG